MAGPSSPTSPSGMSSMLDVSAGRFTGSGVEVDVGGSALADVGGAVLVESVAGVFLLVRTSDSAFSAVDAVCSHQSCTITGADGAILRVSVPRVAIQPAAAKCWAALLRRCCASSLPPSRTGS